MVNDSTCFSTCTSYAMSTIGRTLNDITYDCCSSPISMLFDGQSRSVSGHNYNWSVKIYCSIMGPVGVVCHPLGQGVWLRCTRLVVALLGVHCRRVSLKGRTRIAPAVGSV
jgi:hypothetical protein